MYTNKQRFILQDNHDRHTLYSRVDLQTMLTFMDCDQIEAIPISTLPVLPDWVRDYNLQNLAGTNVRISPAKSNIREEDTRDRRLPQSGISRIIHFFYYGCASLCTSVRCLY